MQRIGFIGASGMMGHGMAKNLRAKGYPLTLTVHRNRDRVADLLAAGATLVATAAEMARNSDIVFLCVTGSPQVEEAVNGPRGPARRRSQGAGHRRHARPPSPSRRTGCAASAQRKGVFFVDAPLARTPVEAEAGKLNVMVGRQRCAVRPARAGVARLRRERLPRRRRPAPAM